MLICCAALASGPQVAHDHLEKNLRKQSYTCDKVIRKTYSDKHALESERDRKQLCWYCKCHCPGAPIHRCTRKKCEKIIEATLLQSKLGTVSKTARYYVVCLEMKDGVEKRFERRVHMEFFLRVYSITWLKVKRLKQLQGSPTKAKTPTAPRFHSLRDEVTEFMSMLPREPCHFTLASHSLYLTTVDSVFDIFKAWLLNKEPGVFEAMQAASYWGRVLLDSDSGIIKPILIPPILLELRFQHQPYLQGTMKDLESELILIPIPIPILIFALKESFAANSNTPLIPSLS